MRKILLIVLLSQSQAAKGEFNINVRNHYENFNKSIVFYSMGTLDSALYYCRLSIKNDSSHKVFTYLGDILCKKGLYKEGVEAYRKSILMGSIPREFKFLFESYDSIKNKLEIKTFEKNYPNLIKTYYNVNYNIIFGNLICELESRDQAIRTLMSNNKSSLAADQLFSIQAYLDTTVNLPAIQNYLINNGLPKYIEMDNEISKKFTQIVHHLLQYEGANTELFQQIIKEAVFQGKYPLHSYVASLDYKYSHKTGKQLYGTFISQGEGNTYFFDPQIDLIETIDARRAEWLLGSLKDLQLTDWRHPALPLEYKY